MATFIPPRVSGGKNYDTYWVSVSNITTTTRAKSIQDRRTNDFCIASIIVNNCTEGLPYDNKLSLDESKSNIDIMSWIA